MTRIATWATALDAFLRDARDRKFRYGSWDCCLVVADAIRAMTGVDVAALYRGQYVSRRAAMRLVGSVEAVAASVFTAHGLREVAPLAAQRGDVVLVRACGRDLLGVVGLDGKNVMVVGLKGLLRVPVIPSVARAWRI